MLLPLALTPMSLQFLEQGFLQTRLRREIRQNLRQRRSFGSDPAGANPLRSRSANPFRLEVSERGTLVVMRAIQTRGTGEDEPSLMGCLDQATGDIEVQESFSSSVPSLCGESGQQMARAAEVP
jgi:hypothetical protein